MRFAYIDSQGNEVTIPSVDALALRIELGAIGPDTQLYDAQADRWGPAHTHEIFHTLSRDVAGEGGFVAPPPPMAPPLDPEAEAEAEPEPAAEAPDRGFSGGFDLEEDEEEDEEEAGVGFDFTLVDAPDAEPEPEAGPLAMDFSLTDATPEPERPAAAAPGRGDEDEEGAFDFGGFGSLELEGTSLDEPAGASGAMSFSRPGAGEPSEPGAGDFTAGGGLELEPPMSEFASQAAPGWREQEGPAGDEGAMDFARGEEDEEAPPPRRSREGAAEQEGAERRERPTPRSRPSPPRRVHKKSYAGLVASVIGLVVVGAGGYFGWTLFRGRGPGSAKEAAAPALPPVTIPDIPAELLPVMRDLGERALADMIADLRGMQAEFDLAAEPRGDWLAGVYLANASQYRDVQGYWEGIGAYVDRVREADTRAFHDRYLARLEAAGLAADTAALLMERADSGFLAARGDRFEAYALMDDLVNASLGLHAFLLQNEASIEYDPAAGGVSRDPVLEAVPATKELGERMWDMVDRITGALDALGTLDRVTTERLTAVLFDRIRRAGFQ